MKRLLTLLFLLLGMFSAQAENMQLEIVQLSHRTAEDVIPILKPLLSNGATLTGMNNQLIIKTDQQNLKEIIRSLQAIDTPLRSLKISVRYDTQGRFRANESGVDGSYRSGDVQIETRNPGSEANDGLIISGQNGQNRVRYRQWATESNSGSDNLYFVRTIEGRPAWINNGKSIPVNNRTFVYHSHGADVYDSVEYQELSSGFYVIPSLNGDRVTLLITPQQQRQLSSYNSYETSGAETSITGKLGQWIDLGGVNEHFEQQSGETLYNTKSSQSDYQHIQVKVEEIH